MSGHTTSAVPLKKWVRSKRVSKQTDKYVDEFLAHPKSSAGSSTPSKAPHKETSKSLLKQSLSSSLFRKDHEISVLRSQNSEMKLRIRELEEDKEKLIYCWKGTSQELAAAKMRLKRSVSTKRPRVDSEIVKYGQFLSLRMPEAEKLNELFRDRVASMTEFFDHLNAPERAEECLLKTLQVISDVLVVEISEKPKQHYEEAENEELVGVIGSQAERIVKLNIQITEAMASSKRLLASPLSRTSHMSMSVPSSPFKGPEMGYFNIK